MKLTQNIKTEPLMAAVSTKIAVYRGVTPWSVLNEYRSFGRAWLLRLESRRKTGSLNGSLEAGNVFIRCQDFSEDMLEIQFPQTKL
jgi:hypothetical protein